MVVASLSPLFILWAIRGARDVPDACWAGFCAACVIFPNLALFARWKIAHLRNDHRIIIVRSARDQSEHLLVYLFAMMIPLFDVDLGGMRDIIAVLVAFAFIVFIFWHMDLHYMNILFALFGYKVFTIEAATSTVGAEHPTRTVVVLSKRHTIPSSTEMDTIRISDTVLVEKE
jgi:Ca2+/Na+ antiporter